MSQDSYRILQSQINNELDEAINSLQQEYTPGKNKMKSSSQNSSRGSSQDQEEVEDVRDYKPINLFMQVKKLKRRNHELEAQFEALRLEALQNEEAFEAEKYLDQNNSNVPNDSNMLTADDSNDKYLAIARLDDELENEKWEERTAVITSNDHQVTNWILKCGKL